MMPVYHWAQTFTVTEDDIEFLTGLLLDGEVPLRTDTLARALVERKLAQEAADLEAKFEGVRVYNPADSYEVEQKVMFPALNYAIGIVTSTRAGVGENYGPFNVMAVQFEDGEGSAPREFAFNLQTPHKLSTLAQNGDSASHLPGRSTLSVDEILARFGDEIIAKVGTALANDDDLVPLTGTWFPRSLILDVNIGHLNLAEAVLDINEGGPLTTSEILEQIGGLGNAPEALQIFSMNYALSKDNRFDEVGPLDRVLWYLRRLEPSELTATPPMLVYTPIEFDESLLTPEMKALVQEIDDEWSDLPDPDEEASAQQVSITLNYPHRRMGTLPLNAKMRHIFPTARRTPRIYVSLVDGQDGEEYVGWVVRKERFVFGLGALYRKHKLPVGARISIRHSEEDPGKLVIDFNAYKPRTEWVRIITPKDNQIAFEDQKRAIGASFDELMLLGADDLGAVDALFQSAQQSRRSLTSIVRTILAELSRTAPQNAVHGKTLYSAVNVMRRCPPGPIFVAMVNSPDFEYVGNNYWKLSAN